jgi:predicted transcriptional regulator
VSTYRINKDKDNPYLMINKRCLDDAALSLKAKGMLTYLLSLPDDWQIYEDEIVRHHKDGKDSVKSAIKELIVAGYIVRERARDDLGRLRHYDYQVYEQPLNNAALIHNGLSNVGKSATTNTHSTDNEIYTKADAKIKAVYDLERAKYLNG